MHSDICLPSHADIAQLLNYGFRPKLVRIPSIMGNSESTLTLSCAICSRIYHAINRPFCIHGRSKRHEDVKDEQIDLCRLNVNYNSKATVKAYKVVRPSIVQRLKPIIKGILN